MRKIQKELKKLKKTKTSKRTRSKSRVPSKLAGRNPSEKPYIPPAILDVPQQQATPKLEVKTEEAATPKVQVKTEEEELQKLKVKTEPEAKGVDMVAQKDPYQRVPIKRRCPTPSTIKPSPVVAAAVDSLDAEQDEAKSDVLEEKLENANDDEFKLPLFKELTPRDPRFPRDTNGDGQVSVCSCEGCSVMCQCYSIGRSLPYCGRCWDRCLHPGRGPGRGGHPTSKADTEELQQSGLKGLMEKRKQMKKNSNAGKTLKLQCAQVAGP